MKRAGKEGNTAERKTAERKAGDKRKITNEEKLDILVSAMLEYLEKQVTSLPEQGRFERHSVSMTYPGTTCDGFLIYECDLTDSSQRGRRLRDCIPSKPKRRICLSAVGAEFSTWHRI